MKGNSLAVITILVLLILCGNAAGSDRVLDFPKLLVDDTVHVFTSPGMWESKDWALFGAAALAVGTVALADQSIRKEVRRNQGRSTSETAKIVGHFGDIYSFAALGLFYAGGEVFHDVNARTTAIDGAAASLVASGIVASGLKLGVGRSRPDDGKGTHHFRPFSDSDASFPSRETTQAFALASTIASHYDDFRIQATAYTIAGLVGMARIYRDAHFTSDVLAGAFIGTAIGTSITRYNQKKRAKDQNETRWIVTPLLARNAGGLSITVIR